MSRTGEQILQAISEVLNDWWTSTTTSAGASDGTSLVDTKLMAFGDNRLSGRYARLTEASNVVRRASRSTQSSGTLTFAEAFAAQVASGQDYQLHRYNPSLKFKAADQARLERDIMEKVFQVKLDDTSTSDGTANQVFDIPSTITQGPHLAFVESPAPADVDWNLLTTPQGDATTGWTATSLALGTRNRDTHDLLVPKYNDTCQSFSVATTTNGTLAQAVAAMSSDVTAALAAGRKMTFAMWVYCLTASRVALKLTDDSTTTTGALHQGRGWELLFVEKTISSTNATTLTATLDVTSAADAVTGFAERRWLYYGDKERVVDAVFNHATPLKVRLDNTAKHFMLPGDPAPRGYQIRLQGKAPLSALGDGVTTQGTNTMEVDENTERVLAVKAAELILGWGFLTTDDMTAVAARIAAVKERMPSLASEWQHKTENYRLMGPYD